MHTTLSYKLLAGTFSVSVLVVPAVAAPLQRHEVHETDTLLAKLTARTKEVDTKLTAARKAGRVPVGQATQMKKKLKWVRTDSAEHVKQHGLLSAADSASDNRTLAEVEATLG